MMGMSGILKDMLKGTPLEGVGIVPKLMQNCLVIEINEQQFKEIALKGIDERIKKYITIEIHEGKIVMKVKLW